MAQVYIIRHGETQDNKDRIFSGWRDVDLNEEGIQEAKEVGEKLKNVHFTKAYASDLLRSQHTLILALGENPNNIPIIIDPRIKERNYGDLAGTSKTALLEKDPENYKLWHRNWDGRPPKGESIADVDKRVFPFLEDLKKDAKPDDIILVSAHGNSIRPMRKYFENLTNEQAASFEHTPAEIFHYTV